MEPGAFGTVVPQVVPAESDRRCLCNDWGSWGIQGLDLGLQVAKAGPISTVEYQKHPFFVGSPYTIWKVRGAYRKDGSGS